MRGRGCETKREVGNPSSTCNVYVIRDGSNCVLVDFGSGKILDYLILLCYKWNNLM